MLVASSFMHDIIDFPLVTLRRNGRFYKKNNSHNKQISRNMTPPILISTLFISTELNEREGYPRLSLSRVSTHSKARPQHRDLRAPLFSNSAWDLLRPAELRDVKEQRRVARGVFCLSTLSEKTTRSNHL